MTTVGEVLDRGRSEILGTVARSFHPVVTRTGAVAIGPSDLLGLRNIDIGETIRAGWRSYRRLHEAGRVTRDTSTTQHVSVGQLSLAYHYDPALEINLNGSPVARIPFVLTLLVETVGFVATVTSGCLTQVTANFLNVRVELKVGPGTVASDPVPLVPAAELHLNRPVALVSDATC
jgi:hypothetical protein